MSAGASLKVMVVSALVRPMPRRMKRLLFLTSVMTHVKDSQLNSQTLHKLNNLMGLCREEKAMELPMMLSKVIWDGRVIEPIKVLSEKKTIPDSQFQDLIHQVITNVPHWLRYGRAGDMEEDLRRLLSYRTELLSH